MIDLVTVDITGFSEAVKLGYYALYVYVFFKAVQFVGKALAYGAEMSAAEEALAAMQN